MHETRAHDPVQRLNAHHLHEVLAIARAFGGAAGHDVITVRFADTIDDLLADRSLRLRFRNLARRATAT